MAKVKIHHFKCGIEALTESDILKLTNLLGVPRNLWKEEAYRDKPMHALKYAYGDANQSMRIYLGPKSDVKYTMHPQTREFHEYYEYTHKGLTECFEAPEGYERYYTKPTLLIHGAAFDMSEFYFADVLTFLGEVGFTPWEGDIAFDDPAEGVTKLEDWLRVFKHWRKHCTGNMLRKQKIRVMEDEKEFDCVRIGKAGKEDEDEEGKANKTVYATFYVRPGGAKRFELKMRKAAQLAPLLEFYSDPEAFKREAIKVLINNIEIFTEESKATKKPYLYIREPFWERFLASAPRKEKKEKGYELEKDLLELQRTERIAFAGLLGRIQSHVSRYASIRNGRDIADDIVITLDKIRDEYLLS